MENNMNPMQQQPLPSTDQMAMPKKKGYGAVVGIIVLVLIILAAFVFWPKQSTRAPASTATSQDQQNDSASQAKAAQAEDLNNLQADIDATNVDGVSNGL